MSAVELVTIAGMLVTGMPSSVAAAKIDAILRDVHRRHRLERRVGGQHVAVDGVVQQRHQDIATLHRLDQLVLRQHPARIGLTSTSAASAQPRQRAFRDRLGDENPRLAHDTRLSMIGG